MHFSYNKPISLIHYGPQSAVFYSVINFLHPNKAGLFLEPKF